MLPAEKTKRPVNKWRRNGPLVLIVALLVGVGGVVVLRGDDDDPASANADGSGNGSGEGSDDALGLSDRPGAPEPTGRMPVTYAEAEDAGTIDDYEWGDRCDPDTGKAKIPSVYAPPCVPVFEGDNGGATTGGVTADEVTVVRYVVDPASDLSSFVANSDAAATPEQLHDTLEDYIEIYGSRQELYGRSIRVVDYVGTGAGDDVVAAKADATQIASELKPFFVIGGPGLDRGAFAQELTSHGIVCLDCAGALPADMMEKMTPLVWGSFPSAEQFVGTLTDWATNVDDSVPEAQQGNALFAGDPAMQDEPRKLGVIHFDQDPPLFEIPDDQIPEGVAAIESYILDFGTMPQKATELIAKYKSEGITTIYFMGDPIMPIYLTSAASEQNYSPEWIFTGTAFTDTNLFGRMYDAEQMKHAFGISQLAAPTDADIQDSIELYRWYYDDPEAKPPAPAQYQIMQGYARFLVDGIQMAGPDLTGETFARGVFRIPPRGGGPTTPQISFGNWGFFDTVDYQAIDDSAEIWWDPTVEAEDETGAAGMGVWRRAHKGERFINEDDVPVPNPFADPDDTVTVVDRLTEKDTPPDYPPPPR
jgi:hypothetical protein